MLRVARYDNAALAGAALGVVVFLETSEAALAAEQQPSVARQDSEEVGVAMPLLKLEAGATLFMRSRSIALAHLVKPAAWVGMTWPLADRLRWGMSAGGQLTTDGNYGVWGVSFDGVYSLVQTSGFALDGEIGLGIAHNAPIVHEDLRADWSLVPLGQVAGTARFRLDPIWLGATVRFQQLSVLGLAAHVSW